MLLRIPIIRSHPDAEPLLLLVAAFLFYTALFFGIVSFEGDFGRDFVVADLLFQGKVLYRDVFYLFGPLAPWANSLLFRLFGPSGIVLLVAGALVTFGIVLLTYLLGRQILSRGVAVIGALIVLAQASYGFNTFCYATPYTFAATYGLFFALVTLYATARALDEAGSRWDLVAGTAAALALASKQEFAVVSLFVVAVGLAFRARQPRRLLATAVASAACYGAVTGVFAFLLFRKVSLSEFLENVHPKQAVLWHYFYENTQYWGSRAWPGILESTTGFLWNLGFIVWGTCVAASLRGLVSGEPRAKKLLLGTLVLAPIAIWKATYLWYYPVLLHAAVVTLILAKHDRASYAKILFMTICGAFFLFRVLPNPATKGYYGLLYFIPSLLVYLYLCFELVEPYLVRVLRAAGLQSAMAVTFIVCFVVPHFFVVNSRWGGNTRSVPTERGLFRLERSEAVHAGIMLAEIGRHSSPGENILLIPALSMYYFVSDREPASKYLQLIYGQLPDGEPERQEITRLTQKTPRLVVIDDFHQELHTPGPLNTFGAFYNANLYRWIQNNYREVRTVWYHDRQVHFLVPKAVRGRTEGEQ